MRSREEVAAVLELALRARTTASYPDELAYRATDALQVSPGALSGRRVHARPSARRRPAPRLLCRAISGPESKREIAMAGVLPNKVGRATRQGCVDVYSAQPQKSVCGKAGQRRPARRVRGPQAVIRPPDSASVSLGPA
jgi:hypothetical protein